jgi:hypothetical protein
MSLCITVTASWVNIVTALATAAAAAAAAWAVISANRVARRSRLHQQLVERHRDCVALLSAFEEIQTLREFRDITVQSVEKYSEAGERDDANEALKLARARCTALLHASPEPLPITRGAFFDHMGLPMWDDLHGDYDAIGKRLETMPQLGDPEREGPDVMRVRGEIVSTIDQLRRDLA